MALCALILGLVTWRDCFSKAGCLRQKQGKGKKQGVEIFSGYQKQGVTGSEVCAISALQREHFVKIARATEKVHYNAHIGIDVVRASPLVRLIKARLL